jgi:ubiquitin carboxyl-terminal hydrolase 25
LILASHGTLSLLLSLVVAHLHSLFINLAHAESPAILPEVQLAKLALMTSKDEEAEGVAMETTATSTGSADTDSTLVDATAEVPSAPDLSMPLSTAAAPPAPSYSVPTSPGSILGKRPGDSLEREREDRRSPMEVYGLVSPRRGQSELESGSSQPQFVQPTDDDIEMVDARTLDVAPSTPPRITIPPPLPPRKRTEPVVGDMMFGDCDCYRGGQSVLSHLSFARQTE